MFNPVEPWSGLYFVWMLNPTAQMISGVVTLLNVRATSSKYWKLIGRFSVLAALTQLLWYHEFLISGPDTQDNLYSDFNNVTMYVYIILAAGTVSASFFSSPRSQTTALWANYVALFLGTGLTWLVEQSVNERKEAQEAYERAVKDSDSQDALI